MLLGELSVGSSVMLGDAENVSVLTVARLRLDMASGLLCRGRCRIVEKNPGVV
jgi:hypothetical protein